MENFNIVLFKNNKKKKILKKFITIENARKYYKKLLKESNDVIFEKQFENGFECKFEISIVSYKTKTHQPPTYLSDKLGRNIRVNLDDTNMFIMEISTYKIEEKIFDTQINDKITTQQFISKYLSQDGFKLISSLNNKIILQMEDDVKIFSVKNEYDSVRFIDSLSSHFFKIKRGDCLFVKDTSSPQRKYLFDLLEKKGFEKKRLYRKFTTHPQK